MDDATACRYLIRLENALKRFHHHYDAAEWEDLPFAELSASLEHVERIADIYECEQVRMSRHPPPPQCLTIRCTPCHIACTLVHQQISHECSGPQRVLLRTGQC